MSILYQSTQQGGTKFTIDKLLPKTPVTVVITATAYLTGAVDQFIQLDIKLNANIIGQMKRFCNAPMNHVNFPTLFVQAVVNRGDTIELFPGNVTTVDGNDVFQCTILG